MAGKIKGRVEIALEYLLRAAEDVADSTDYMPEGDTRPLTVNFLKALAEAKSLYEEDEYGRSVFDE